MAVSTRTWTTGKGEIHKAHVVRYRDGDGKYRLKTFKTKKEAADWGAQTRVDLKKGIHRPDSTAKTISEAGAFWLGICEDEGVEPEAIRNYRTHLKYHITPALAPEKVPDAWKGEFGALKLSRLTGPVSEAFRLRVLKSPARNWRGEIIPGRIIARRTQQHVWASFEQMLNVAVKHGLIPYNPAHTITLDAKEREKVRIRPGEQIPDRPDVRDIIAASTGKWRVLFSLDSFSGLRSSELRALDWPAVYLERGEVEVVRRAEWRTGQIGPCKSDTSKRTIQIPDDIVDLLRRWKLVCPPSPDNLVFPYDDGNVMPRDAIIDQLYAIERRLGIVRPDGKLKPNNKPRHPNGKPKYNVHSLRHFYASIMIDVGTPPKRLQELLGHSSLALTMDTYGHLFPAGEAEKRRPNDAFAAVLQDKTKRAGSPSRPSITKAASASLSVPRAGKSRDRDSVVAMSRGRPTLGNGSRRVFGQQGVAAVPPRALPPNTALTSQSTLLKRTPGQATKEAVFVEPSLKGWAITTGARTLGRYRTYSEAEAAVQALVSSAQSAH